MAEPIRITIPELALVALVGASGSGKSTFARAHFLATEVLSSDHCRALVSDDENSLEATTDAFAVLHFIAAKRLARGKLVVVDATNVQPEARRPLVQLAREHHCIPVAIVLDMPEKLCQERNRARPERSFGPHVVRNHVQQLRRSLRGLGREGFRHVYVLSSPEEVAAVEIVREPLRNDLRHERGPFDVVGDVHGCHAELVELLGKLGYEITPEGARHPEGRKLVFLGDLVDRGPDTPGVLKIVMESVAAGTALCLPGNHDVKLMRKLRGRDVQVTHGLAESLEQLERETPELRRAVADFLDGLVSHYVLDGGELVVAHAGMREEMQGRGSGRVRDFALYGETTGETDEFGLPVRHNWAAEYRGRAHVVYGHTPVPEPEWLNRTINVDTGCVFGGKLTALRWPERELVSVPAGRTYAEPARPFLAEAGAAPADERPGDLLDLEDVLGKRVVETRLMGRVTIREENAAAALEAMSRFATDPRWLVYLPPTMSPSETSRLPDLLEHPAEAFAYYRGQGVPRVVCEAKHMGSRAVVVVCRDGEVARRRFGVATGEAGVVYTRTGRRFFEDGAIEAELLARARGVRRERSVERSRHRLGRARLRADAVVGQGAGAAAAAVRGGGRGGARGADRGAAGAGAGGGARARSGRAGGAQPRSAGDGRAVRRGVPPLLLAGGVARRPEAGAVPPARDRAGRARRPRPPLAHDDARAPLRGRPGAAAGDAAPGGRHDRRGQPGGGRALVGGADRGRWGGDGREAARLRGEGRAGRPGAAGGEVPRARVPADHLRPGVHRARAPGAAAPARAGRQARARPAGIRARAGGARAFRPARAAVPRARVRRRRAGAGERADRPAAVRSKLCRAVTEKPRRAAMMRAVRLGIGLDPTLGLSFEEHRQLAREAARLGYHDAWTPAGAGGRDSFHVCAQWWMASAEVTPVGLTTGISVVPVPVWTAPTLAMQAATVGELTGGRFILGIGTGGIQDEGFRRTYGVPAWPPLAMTRDYMVALKGLLGGQAVSHEGKAVTLRGARTSAPQPVPVYLAALGPRMLRLAGELADGVLPNWSSPEQRVWIRERVAEGARKAGRDPGTLPLVEYIRVCVDEDEERARRAFAKAVIPYAMVRAGGSKEHGYRAHFARMGFDDALNELEARRDAGTPMDELAEAFPAELLRRVGYFGRPEGAAGAFRELARGLDTAIVRVVAAGGGLESARAAMNACRPELVLRAA